VLGIDPDAALRVGSFSGSIRTIEERTDLELGFRIGGPSGMRNASGTFGVTSRFTAPSRK